MRTVNKCSMHGVYLYWLAHLRMFRSKAPVIRERFAEIVIRASVLAGVPLMFKLLNHCASVNVRLGLHVAEMLQLPRLFSCAKCTFPAFCGIIRLGRLWQRCSSCHDCFSYANRTPPCSVSCVNVRLGLLWLKG